MNTMRAALIIAALLVGQAAALAVTPGERLPDSAMEKRAREISAELRCLVCQNQSIDDSDAPLARDLRTLVRDRLKAGDSDRQVLDFVVARYGEFVLLRPPIGWHTALLWGGPFLIFAAGAFGLWRMRRQRIGKPVGARLSETEQAELQRILAEKS
jgi:cytochrome c-type biogenesis protein CcmH